MKPDDLPRHPDPWEDDLCNYNDKSDSVEAASWCAVGLIVIVLVAALVGFARWLI